MTSWQGIAEEVQKRGGDFDGVRREKYTAVAKLTKRPLLIYATAWHNQKGQLPNLSTSLDFADKDGFFEITKDITSKEVDVLLHSPGGYAEAAESIVALLRSKFNYVRFIVLGSAKSAATMLALSGNEILMDVAGELGPIDPQMNIKGRQTAVGSIEEQFEIISKRLQGKPGEMPAWIPILQEYAPALLVQCRNARQLAETLAVEWMKDYMFKGEKDGEQKAQEIANYLNDEKATLSHARRLDAKALNKKGLKVEALEDQEQEVQDALRTAHVAVMVTLEGTDAYKIFENSEGGAFIKNVQVIPPRIQLPFPPQNPPSA